MNRHSITSPHNQRVKNAIRLRGRRPRSKQGRTLIDGTRELARAIDAQIHLVEAFVCEPLCQSDASRRLAAQLEDSGTRVWHVTTEVFQRLAFGRRHEGIVAVAEIPRRTIDDLQVSADALVAVVCGLEKPGNVGAVLRSADAAGVEAVVVADPGTDLYNPNCIRASLGTVFVMPVCEASSAQTLAWLRGRRARIFAARPDATLEYSRADYRGHVAIVLGSEAAGLSDPWQADDITPIKLPMRGSADSLNVSAAAAVLFYEAMRQRTVRH
jgi:TrmH family RNA methyltransferase